VGRYRGSIFGLLWSLINPILMLAVYTFIFGVVFKTRWGAETGGHANFTVNLFAGMIVHGFFAETVNRAPALVVSNVNYVKKVVFPLEILSWVTVGAALFHTGVSMLVLLGFNIVVSGRLESTILLTPVLFIPLTLILVGVIWFLSSLGVFVRDIGQVVGFVTTLLLFMSPVFYPVTALPEQYRMLLQLNPLTFYIEEFRKLAVAGDYPDWGWLAANYLAGIMVAYLGFAWFQKTRQGFSDVL